MSKINQTNVNQRPTETAEEVLARHQPEARAIQETSAAAVLATCLGKTYGKMFGSVAFKAYHDIVLTEAGSPKDPIEVMLVQQLLWAHHRLGDLHAQSACAESVEVTEAYNAAAVRLMAEFRKTSLAVREYRTPVVPRNVTTVVKQQNVAAGDQQIAYLDGQAVTPGAAHNSANTKLVSKQLEALTHAHPDDLFSQSEAGCSREAEPAEARPIDAGRTRAPAALDLCEPAVGKGDRPSYSGGQSPLRAERRMEPERAGIRS